MLGSTMLVFTMKSEAAIWLAYMSRVKKRQNESSSFMDAKGLNQLRNWVTHVMQSAWYAQPICTQKYQFLDKEKLSSAD